MSDPRHSPQAHDPSAPFSLRRPFVLIVLPALCLALGGLLVAVSTAITGSVESAFAAEVAGQHRRLLVAAGDGPEAPAALADEAAELGYLCAAMLDPADLAAAESTCPPPAGITAEELAEHGPLFAEDPGPEPAWIVASLQTAASGAPVALISRHPAAAAETRLRGVALGWTLGLAAVFLGALALALRLVIRAQHEIDRRTAALVEARAAVARFASAHARRAASAGHRARRVQAVLLFPDIRDFSGFADRASPEAAAALAGDAARIGMEAVLAHGGDVDRLLGDGMMARFDGERRQDQAWAAAEALLRAAAARGLPRRIGVSVHEGEAVEATIAAGDRADFTLLGQSVNIGARLCAAAGPGEIVAEAQATLPEALRLEAGAVETLALKGHRDAVAIRRFRPAPARGAAEGEGTGL